MGFKKIVSVLFDGRQKKTEADPVFQGLSVLNLEPSYACNLKCLMCQRSVRDRQEGVMSAQTFERLEPFLKNFTHVVLTGAGEPTINPRLPNIIRAVRSSGAVPTMSSNGTLLTETMAREILAAGLDHFTVSIDAGTRDTYERIRVGAKWDDVLPHVTKLNELRKSLPGHLCPGGSMWAFVLMRDNFRELPEAVRLAAQCGFDAVLTNFISINMLEYEKDQVFHDEQGNVLPAYADELSAVLKEADHEAKRLGIVLSVTPFRLPSHIYGCVYEPTRSLFIDCMGYVSPCCLLPAQSESNDVLPFVFGNINETPLDEILRGERYREYRRCWGEHRLPDYCKSCYVRHRIDPSFFAESKCCAGEGCQGGCC